MNNVQIVGYIGKDPEVVTSKEGKVFKTSFSVATNHSFYSKLDAEWKTETQWHNIVVWRDASKYLSKGDLVEIVGMIKYSSFEGRDGVKRYVTEIHSQEVHRLKKKNVEVKEPELEEEPELEDDLPF